MRPGPGYWTTFLYYFATTVVIGGLTASQALHIAPSSPTAIQVGIVLGAIAGFGGAYFNRSVIWEIPIQGRKVFLNRLEQSLKELKLELVQEDDTSETPTSQQSAGSSATEEKAVEDNIQVYAPNGTGSLFSGRLYVNIQDKKAEFMGRSSLIQRLKKIL